LICRYCCNCIWFRQGAPAERHSPSVACSFGSPSDTSNYRPISLTCISCKLLESILCHLVQHSIINKHQHGFLRRKSTATHLLECTLDWNIALNSRRLTAIDIVYLDYAKAFDSVIHSKLLAKLSCYGINEKFIITAITPFKVIHGHQFWYQSKACECDFLPRCM